MKARGFPLALRFAAAAAAALLVAVLLFAAAGGSSWIFLVPAAFSLILMPAARAALEPRAAFYPPRQAILSRSRSPPAP